MQATHASQPAGLRRSLPYALDAAGRGLGTAVSDALAHQGLPVEQWRVLQALSDGHGLSMGDLAAAALLPPPTLTKVVDRLAAQSLVYRRQDTADRRRVAVYLSAVGRRRLAAADAQVAAVQERVVAALGPARTARLMDDLQALEEAMRPEGGG
jgi:DNA-binding MarR family transcriptional regulator